MRRIALSALILLSLIAFTSGGSPDFADAGVPTDFTLSLDCDDVTAGIQSACTVPMGPSVDVELVLTNNTASPHEIGAFNFEVHDPNTTRLNPPPIGCTGSCFSSNPDFHQEALAPIPGDWSCNPPAPDNDTGEDGAGTAVSFLSCGNFNGTGSPPVPPGGSIVLGFVRYAVPTNGSAGSVALTIAEAFVFDDSVNELGSCNPAFGVTMTCNGATVTVAPLTVAIDCSTAPGIQSKCYVSNTLATKDVNVVARNNTNAAFRLGTFNASEITHLDDSRLFAPSIGSGGGFLDSNPDFIAQTGPPLADWACGPGGTDNDAQSSPGDPGQISSISCFNGSGTGPIIAAAGTLALATVKYNIVAGADPGSLMITLNQGGVFDDTFTPRGACPPGPAMVCTGAELVFYCQIAQADAVHDGRVNSGDLGKVASKFGVVPAPANEDQNFDGVINSGDLGLVASVFNQYVVNCP